MGQENKNLEKKIEGQKSSKIGNIVFWLGIIIWMVGIYIGKVIIGPEGPSFISGVLIGGMIGTLGLVLAFVGLLLIRREKIIKYFLVLIISGVVAVTLGFLYRPLAENILPKIAVATKNSFICQLIFPSNVWLESNCYTEVAIITQNFTLCDKIGYGEEEGEVYQGNREFCYEQIAITAKDFALCNKISNEWRRGDCYEGVARITKDESICEKFPSLINRDTCYRGVAAGKKDLALCERIIDFKAKDECYSIIAEITKDPAICGRISDEERRRACYSLLHEKTGIIFPKSTEDEIADWQTYMNEEYGFEIKYPINCSIEEVASSISIDNNCGFRIEIHSNSDSLSLEEWLNYRRETNPTGVDLIFRTPISIDGTLGLKGLDGCCMTYTKGIVLSKGEKIYIIIGNENIFDQTEERKLWLEGEIDDSDDIFNQMLSTFRFIEEDETADWQNYFNSAANFTFEYPKSWEIREEYFYKDNPNPTVVICREEELEGVIANCIQINMPQFPCETVSWFGWNWIGICTDDPKIVEVYEKLVSSFKIIEVEM